MYNLYFAYYVYFVLFPLAIRLEDHIETVDETQVAPTKMYLEKSSTTTASSESTSYASSSASNLGPTSSLNEFQNVAGTSRMSEYGLTTFLDYNEQRKTKQNTTFCLLENVCVVFLSLIP